MKDVLSLRERFPGSRIWHAMENISISKCRQRIVGNFFGLILLLAFEGSHEGCRPPCDPMSDRRYTTNVDKPNDHLRGLGRTDDDLLFQLVTLRDAKSLHRADRTLVHVCEGMCINQGGRTP